MICCMRQPVPALLVSPGQREVLESVARSSSAPHREEVLVKFAQVRQGRGRKTTIPEEKIDEIVELTLNYRPAGETHWSCRTMAAATGVSKSTVQQVWSARGLKPHRVETFKLSNDPKFEEKLVDVVGLYLNPPQKAI